MFTKVSYKKYSLFERNNQYKRVVILESANIGNLLGLFVLKAGSLKDFFRIELFQIYKWPHNNLVY